MSASRILSAGAVALALILSAQASAQCSWNNGLTAISTTCPVGVGTTPLYQFHVTSPTDVWSLFQRGASTSHVALVFRTGSDTVNDWLLGKKAGSENLKLGYGTFSVTPVTFEPDGDVLFGASTGQGSTGQGRIHINETRPINHQLILGNGGTYHTGFIASSTSGYVLTDTAAWGIFGGPNTYLSGAANRVVMPLATDVPGFFITRANNLNGSPLGYILTVLRTGKIGINTTTPGVGTGRPTPNNTALDVVGDVFVEGTVRGTNVVAHYQDLAEWVVADGDLAAGTVVIVAPDQRDVVTASSEAYDTRVAGVVSHQPGVLLGVPGDSKVMVATTGRVKVKVDATQRPIRAGDVLVSSDKPGTAMKSEPIEIGGRRFHQPGTIIGKALEPLEKGTGEILVLLSLQ